MAVSWEESRWIALAIPTVLALAYWVWKSPALPDPVPAVVLRDSLCRAVAAHGHELKTCADSSRYLDPAAHMIALQAMLDSTATNDSLRFVHVRAFVD